MARHKCSLLLVMNFDHNLLRAPSILRILLLFNIQVSPTKSSLSKVDSILSFIEVVIPIRSVKNKNSCCFAKVNSCPQLLSG